MARMATIESDETFDVTKASVFHAWSDLLNLADNWSMNVSTQELDFITNTQPSGVLYGYDLSSTSLVFNNKKIQNTADDWKSILTSSLQSRVVISWPATRPVPPRFPIFRPDNPAIIDFCAQHNIFFDCMRYYAAILDQFENTQSVKVDISSDHEIENYEKLHFRVSLADEIGTILAQEDTFEDYVQQLFSPDILSNFAITLEVVDAR